mmetsp:Transcript_111121/g.301554  ORF Transcript_111121/g.301554 Transcript_111121/m.301554 type:complete len:254 (-) Transcript_111121:790-1551(-)
MPRPWQSQASGQRCPPGNCTTKKHQRSEVRADFWGRRWSRRVSESVGLWSHSRDPREERAESDSARPGCEEASWLDLAGARIVSDDRLQEDRDLGRARRHTGTQAHRRVVAAFRASHFAPVPPSATRHWKAVSRFASCTWQGISSPTWWPQPSRHGNTFLISSQVFTNSSSPARHCMPRDRQKSAHDSPGPAAATRRSGCGLIACAAGRTSAPSRRSTSRKTSCDQGANVMMTPRRAVRGMLGKMSSFFASSP